MSDACFLEFLKIIEHGLAECSLILAELGIFVFQINGFRLLELVIEEVRLGEVPFDKY